MEEKVLEHKWEDGALCDICDALDRAENVVRTADDINDDKAKFKLLEGVNIILNDCIDAIKTRMKNGEILTDGGIMTPPLVEEDD